MPVPRRDCCGDDAGAVREPRTAPASMRVTHAGTARTLGLAGSPDAAKRPGRPPPEMETPAMNLLEDPGRFHWKWIAIASGLLILYAIERTIRTGGLF